MNYPYKKINLCETLSERHHSVVATSDWLCVALHDIVLHKDFCQLCDFIPVGPVGPGQSKNFVADFGQI